MLIAACAIIAIAGYLLGSIPTGFLMARVKGVDIRTVGSGNIGATNAFRVLGTAGGTFVLLLDALKGFAAVALTVNFYPELRSMAPAIFPAEGPGQSDLRFNLAVLAGISAVLGHNYTCWLKFKGGKGIATTAGVFLALTPVPLGIAFVVWAALFLITRYVSVASIGAAIALPVAVWVLNGNVLLGIVTTALGALAIFKHRSNIQRLRAGTENRIRFGKERGTT